MKDFDEVVRETVSRQVAKDPVIEVYTLAHFLVPMFPERCFKEIADAIAREASRLTWVALLWERREK